jgi:thioesterase domain-containing protein/acyl carrier protein
VIFLDMLPVDPNGKLDRRATAEIKQSLVVQGSQIAPRNSVEQQLAMMWERLLGVSPISVQDSFFDLGGHSLLALRLINQLEKTFGKPVSLASLFQYPTIEELAKLLRDEVAHPHWNSLMPLQSSGSKMPFFWVHGEDSDASLPRFLGPEQPVYGIIHQAHDGKAARYKTVETIAAHYLAEIRSVQTKGPYFLGGYCFGGMIAFEIAQQLIKAKEPVSLLMLLAPSLPRVTPRPKSVRSKREHPFGRLVLQQWRYITGLTARETFTYLVLRSKGKATEYVTKILTPFWKIAQWIVCMACTCVGRNIPFRFRSPYILGIYRKAINNYLPAIYSGCMIIFTPKESFELSQRWRNYVTGKVEMRVVPGDHTGVLKEENVRVWGPWLKAYLDQAEDRTECPR